MREKFYIGDGVYAKFDPYGVTLTTEDGRSITNTVVLEWDLYLSLVKAARAYQSGELSKALE